MMEKLPRQAYTSEFRQQAVELILREDLGIAEASRHLSLSPKTLTRGCRAASSRKPWPRCRGCGERTPSCGWNATS